MSTEQAALGPAGASSISPRAGASVELLASTALTTDPNTVSSIVSVTDARWVWLWIKADVGAAGAYAHLVPFVSGAAAEPEIGDDSWFALPERDATATATLLAGSVPTGADWTIAPEWGVVTVRPLVIRTEAGDAGTDKIRMVVPINVAGARWLYVAAEEVTGNMTLAIDWTIAL